jgi:glutathione synthase/RimK-type ligase-like ATP-grasp enzyme
MSPAVLIVAGLYDFSADLVAQRLSEAGVAFLRLNREHFPNLRFGLDPLARTLSVRGPELDALIGPGLRSVWFRQPVFLRNAPAEALAPAEQLARSQWAAFGRALCVLKDAAWMNHPQLTYLAESKPYQLALAIECGFKVPETLVGNDATGIQQLFPSSLIVKSLDTVLLRDGEDCLFTYSTVADSSVLSESNTAEAPILAQRLLEPKIDLRITIVGKQVFAVRIIVEDEGVQGDWRIVPRERLVYEDVEIDGSVQEACRTLVEHLGLAFAAIDLIETPDGIFFIEVNPTGEWGWLTTPERPIDKAIANWLANPDNARA